VQLNNWRCKPHYFIGDIIKCGHSKSCTNLPSVQSWRSGGSNSTTLEAVSVTHYHHQGLSCRFPRLDLFSFRTLLDLFTSRGWFAGVSESCFHTPSEGASVDGGLQFREQPVHMLFLCWQTTQAAFLLLLFSNLLRSCHHWPQWTFEIALAAPRKVVLNQMGLGFGMPHVFCGNMRSAYLHILGTVVILYLEDTSYSWIFPQKKTLRDIMATSKGKIPHSCKAKLTWKNPPPPTFCDLQTCNSLTTMALCFIIGNRTWLPPGFRPLTLS
jgi:hypothetical protein